MNHQHYSPRPRVQLPERSWPDNILSQAPVWCSVDLRDGNQALEKPMSLEQKLEFFRCLLRVGFREIEVGFPAAAETEYLFVRQLIEREQVPADLWIQVLTQGKPHIIDRTVESLRGVRQATIHLYVPVSEAQRRLVFQMDHRAYKTLATEAASYLCSAVRPLQEAGSRIRFEFTAESFSGADLDYALELCQEVAEILGASREEPLVLNLPNTVELSGPHIYADQIEYFLRNFQDPERICLSVHSHNDRGTGVAATELALLAGAQRVEGTLFGNGERTGNADLLVLAMNLLASGVDPKLDFSQLDQVVDTYERCTGMTVAPRHPYAGALVYTAFSGSHQDAIKKSLDSLKPGEIWDIPYLPIDPQDIGRDYEPLIRINAQSGKAGLAYVMQRHFGIDLPQTFAQEFSRLVTDVSDRGQKSLSAQKLKELFWEEYVNGKDPLELCSYDEKTLDEHHIRLRCVLKLGAEQHNLEAEGTGLLDAFAQILKSIFKEQFSVRTFRQQDILSQRSPACSRALSFVRVRVGSDYVNACGLSFSVSRSSLRALVSAANRAMKLGFLRQTED